jgi:hypothetical protein
VRLDVRVLGAEERRGAVAREPSISVHHLAAAVVALAGVPSAYLFVGVDLIASSTGAT